MATIAIFTPTLERDLECFQDLRESVLRYTGNDVVHHVAVSRRDLPLFRPFESERTHIITKQELLPRRFISTYTASQFLQGTPVLGRHLPPIEAINARRPWPPIRGWILQQIVKIAAVGHLEADVVLIADSDIALIRPVDVEQFLHDGDVRLYRSADPLTPDLTRHVLWHSTARHLLSLPRIAGQAEHDYISSLVAWDPRIVRKIQTAVQEATGLHWMEAVARELHFSEYILYGCYVEAFGTERERSFTETDSLCRSYWSEGPLTKSSVEPFLDSIQEQDLAVHVQSTSKTAPEVRRYVIAAAQARVSA